MCKIESIYIANRLYLHSKQPFLSSKLAFTFKLENVLFCNNLIINHFQKCEKWGFFTTKVQQNEYKRFWKVCLSSKFINQLILLNNC